MRIPVALERQAEKDEATRWTLRSTNPKATLTIVIVTKADLGGVARRALSDLKGALSLAPPRSDGWTTQAASCSTLHPSVPLGRSGTTR